MNIALFRQQDPNWKVVFFRPDNSISPSERQDKAIKTLEDLLDNLGESRAAFARFSLTMGNLTLVQQLDKLLSAWALAEGRCGWVSVVSVSTVLGSNIVQQIRQQSPQSEVLDDDDDEVDMILAPMDSYYFPTQSKKPSSLC